MRLAHLLQPVAIILAIAFFATQLVLITYVARNSKHKFHRTVPKEYHCTTVHQKPEVTQKLGKKVDKVIYDLQNPKDCKSARKLICTLKVSCGLGCSVHHIGICMFLGIGTNRTVQLDFDNPWYTKPLWETAFLPLSDTCNNVDAEVKKSAVEIKGEDGKEATVDHKVVKLDIIGAFDPFITYAPFTIPASLKRALDGAHDLPHFWWIGHVLAYVTRVQPTVRHDINMIKRRLGFVNPVVGVHVRRSDKILEADYFSIDDYMDHVINLSSFYPAGDSPFKVFLATDDWDIFDEAMKKYPYFKFLTIRENSIRTLQVRNRDSPEFLHGVVQDILLLTECDHFVGTLSSNVGRLVYTLMLAKSHAENLTICSLDSEYVYYGSVPRYQEALTAHKAENGSKEIDLDPGDLLMLSSGYKCDNRCFAVNSRTRKTGFYPVKKVREYANPIEYTGFKLDSDNLF